MDQTLPQGQNPPADAPTHLGRYRLGTVLGQGGAGQVVNAVMLGPGGFEKPVALKVLHTGADEIRREARIGGLLRHENLVDVYEIGEQEGQWFCAMERCEGTLSALLPLPARAVIEAGLQVCAALQYAHQDLGLVHLDLKPANLLFANGRVKVADLGIARATGFDGDGRIRGTPAYMAPEQLGGYPVDPRTDIYALGLTLRELAVGRPRIEDTLDLASDDSTLDLADAPTVSMPGVAGCPPWLEPIVERCVAPNPAERWQSMAELADALRVLPVSGPGLREVLPQPRPAPKHTSVGTNLAPSLDAFVGRGEDLQRLLDQVEPGLLTLKGPAGIGKTRLATELALQWRTSHGGEAWFFDLTEVAGLDGFLVEVARVLDVGLSGPQQDQIGVLGHALAGRGPLVAVFDNFEQILGLASVLETWATRTDEAVLLVTSRQALHLDGERVFDVSPLDQDGAMELLIARAHQRGARIAGDPDLPALAARLDGVPLALELAAGRMGVLSVADVLERMSLSLLRQAADGRHGTLEAALDWSWDLLSPAERAAMGQLSVFAGGFDLEAVEAVVHLDGSVLDTVASLVDRSMVRALGDGRLALLVSIQAYSAARLDDPGPATRRHVRHYAQLGQPAQILALDRHGGHVLRQRNRRELANLALACRRACAAEDGDSAMHTLRAAWSALVLAGPYDLGHRLLEAVLAIPGPTTAQLECDAGRIRATIAADDTVLAHFERGRALALEADDVGVLCQALHGLGDHHRQRGRNDEARAFYLEALPLTDEPAASEQRGNVLQAVALTHQDTGDYAAAQGYYDEALAILCATGDRRREGIARGNQGGLRVAMGDIEGAMPHFRACMDIARELGNRSSLGIWLSNLGILERRKGRPEEAERLYLEAITVHREVGARRYEGVALGNLASIEFHDGRVDQGRAHALEALAIHEEVGNARSAALVRVNLATSDLQADRVHRALVQLEASEAVFAAIRDHRVQHPTLVSMAECHRRLGATAAALDCLDRAAEAATHAPNPLLTAQHEAKRAEVLWGAGDQRAARAALARAEDAADPEDADCQKALAAARHTVG